MIQSCIVSRKVGQSRIYALYMTVYLVIFLPEIRYLHCIYIWFWPTQIIRYAYHSYLSTFIQTLLLVFNHTPTCVHSHSCLCTFTLLLVYIRTPTCVHPHSYLSTSALLLVYIRTHTWVHPHSYLSTFAILLVYIRTPMCTFALLLVYIHTPICVHSHSYLCTFTLLLVYIRTPACVHSHSYLCTFALLLVFIRTPTCVHSYKILSSSKFKHTGVGAFPDQHALRVMRTNPCIYHVLSQHCHILVRCTRELCWPKH